MGVVIIAVLESFYFNLAINLAKSIKKYSDLPVTLISDRFTHPIFDQVIKPDMSHHSERLRFNPFKLKTYIYDYTPYDQTLFLDADNLCIADLSPLLDKLKDVDFQIHEVKRWTAENRHRCKMVWTDKAGIDLGYFLEAHGLDGVYPEYNSSFIWFKKSPENEAYFNEAKLAYNDRRLKYKDIGSCYPDELAWGKASVKLNHYSAIEGFKPIYHNWETSKRGGTIDINKISKGFWFLGMAGGLHTPNLKYVYKQLTGYTFDSRKKIFHVR